MTINGITGASGSETLQTTPSPAPALPAGVATQDMFLKLLVAQIKNQNPLNPADGVEFLSQLAQFTQLEQTIGIRQGIDGLRSDISGAAEGGQQ